MEVSYWEHEQLCFRLLDGLLDAVRKNGVWVRPDNTFYLGIDVRTYGSRITQAEAEAEAEAEAYVPDKNVKKEDAQPIARQKKITEAELAMMLIEDAERGES